MPEQKAHADVMPLRAYDSWLAESLAETPGLKDALLGAILIGLLCFCFFYASKFKRKNRK